MSSTHNHVRVYSLCDCKSEKQKNSALLELEGSFECFTHSFCLDSKLRLAHELLGLFTVAWICAVPMGQFPAHLERSDSNLRLELQPSLRQQEHTQAFEFTNLLDLSTIVISVAFGSGKILACELSKTKTLDNPCPQTSSFEQSPRIMWVNFHHPLNAGISCKGS